MSSQIIRKFVWGNNSIPKRIRTLEFECHQSLEVFEELKDLKQEKNFFFFVTKKAGSPIDQTFDLQITFEDGKMSGAKFIIADGLYKILLRVEMMITESKKDQDAFWDLFSSTATFFKTLQIYAGVKNNKKTDGK